MQTPGRRAVRVLTAVAIGVAGLIALRRLTGAAATDDERDGALPGDGLLPDAQRVATRATVIARPPDEVWPWIAQIGQDRAGFYSLTWIENSLGARIRNADRIEPAWQDRAVGDIVPGDGRGRVRWRVERIDPGRALVLRGVAPADAPADAPAGPYEFVWAFVLGPGPGGCRLVVRERWRHDGTLAGRALVAVLSRGSGVMTRSMLRGVRRRAERTA